MIDVENHAVRENYSCEIRDFEHQVKITWYVEITPWKFEGFVNEVQCSGKRWQLLGLLEPRVSKFDEIARS